MTRIPVLVYDGECGFCTRSVRLVDRLPVRVRVTPWQEADLAALGTTREQAEREVVWVGADGTVSGGAAAVADLLSSARFPFWVVGRVLALPVVRSVAAVAYRLVAANRHRLPGSTPACQLPPQQRPGA